MKTCPTCGQKVREERAGVKLNDFYARLFDYVLANPGATTSILSARFGIEGPRMNSRLEYLNELFAGTDITIRGKRGHGYRVMGL